MKCTIPEISWHNREPVLSIDLHPCTKKFYRLATGGADCHVLIWQLSICDNGAVKIDPLSDLTRHQRAVNVVRWSPSGQFLATADDDANIIIWNLKTDNIPLLEGETTDKEIWIINKVMRGHKEDIYDLCWSPNESKILSGSVDNTAILWDIAKGKSDCILTDHKGFVQGVSWDPKGQYFATISTDRICRIYESTGKHIKARIQKGHLPVAETHYLHNKEVKYFHDDTFKSFFRRLDFSPDGTLLAVPSGRIEIDDSKKVLNSTYLFAVESWSKPVAVLPSGKQCSTVTSFCPILYELRPEGPKATVALPYRMILAVGTDHDVILYDTQQEIPLAYFRDIHYTRLTDLTWSQDGLLLMASSTDGFCAFITFESNELGVQYVKEESEVEDSILDISASDKLQNDKVDITPSKSKKPNLLEQWTIKTPKKIDNTTSNTQESQPHKRKEVDDPPVINKLVPKRIKPVTISDNSSSCKKPESIDVAENTVTPKKTNSKSNPLLNYLKSGSKKEQRRSSKKDISSTAIDKSEKLIQLVADEAEARDAWKCEKSETEIAASGSCNIVEESLSDFSLHLESNSAIGSDADKMNVSHEHMSINDPQNDKQLNVLKENLSKCEEKIEQNCNMDSQDLKEMPSSVGPLSAKTNVKKRVPLITLSSPKRKK